LELEVIVSHRLSLSEMDTLKTRLDTEIRKKFLEIFKTIIITESEEKKITKFALPVEDRNELASKIFDKYGEAPYFVVVTLEEGQLKEYKFFANKFIDREKRKGILISDWLTSKKIDKIITRKPLKKGPKLVFNNSMTKLEVTERKYLKDIIDKEKEITKNT
jgi:predicted Fe-Mo cluster-binding NifX family protein